MTDPKKTPLTRDTFEYCASCLNAFERVLMVLHDLEKERPDKPIVKYFEEKTKKHLDMIIGSQRYYRFAYHALLIKENIKTLLDKDTKSLLINAGRRAFYAFCGGLFIFQGVRELAVMKLDFGAMESGIGKFREAFKEVGWDMLPSIQEIVLAASETVEHDDFGVFQQCYEKHKKVSWLEGMKWSKQRMIRYALVSHLCLFCTEKHSEPIQEPAMDLMVKLVTGDEGKQWRNDEQIFEAMIESLISIGKNNQEYQQTTIDVLEKIRHSQNVQQKRVVNGLLEGKTPCQILKSDSVPQEGDIGCTLFNVTRQRLGLERTHSICERNEQILKDYYKNDLFVKVSLFSNKDDQRHIKTFDFNLEQYEKVVVSQDREGQSSQDNYNQRENNQQRTTMVRKSITMQDLFKNYGNLAHRFQENAQRILVIGNPGIGKTCLSKRLCYDWANGSWGTKFTHVYLLPIRRLSETGVENEVELPAIIRHMLYKTSGAQDSKNILYNEVKDNLSQATTLLILDGYDEAGEMAMELVSSALKLDCSLLILSRPYSVQDIRQRVGIEIECLEFSNRQLEGFIREELGPNDGDDLLEFLSQNSSIKDTCRVAVNLQIITKLWKSSLKEELIKSSCVNLTSFYDMICKYLWNRFTDKEDRFDIIKTFDSLEHIAFESFEKGLVEIPQSLILKHAQESMKVFCASGFLLFVQEGTVFHFAHLTFHEYFAGRYLAKMFMSTSGDKRRKAERFISEHKYIETSRVMLSFMTQCYCKREDMEGSLEAFKDLMEVLNKDPLPAISLQHLFLRMRTLDAFLPCGLDEAKVHTNDDVMHIVNDAMDALKRLLGYEFGDGKGERVLMRDDYLRTPIVDELARMPNLFNRFPNLLELILLGEISMDEGNYVYSPEAARIGRFNPHQALQCILPMLEDMTDKEQAIMIHLCAFIGPMCAEPALDHLKRLCKSQDPKTRKMATRPLVAFIDLFPEREDVRQLMVDASRDQDEDVREALMWSIRFGTFTPETEAGAFVWDLLIEATKDDQSLVREHALCSCVRHYQTFAKSIDEVMELMREFAVSQYWVDRTNASYEIRNLIQTAPKKSEELLVLLTALCRDPDIDVRYRAVESFQHIAKSSWLTREDLFNVAFDLFKDGYPDVQVELLPFLFIFDKKENHCIAEVNEWIANCQDLAPRVRKKAVSCSKANALLSNYTIEEIHGGFYDQDEEVQTEIVRQFDMREMESNKGADAIAEMAAHCLQYDELFKPWRSLLQKLSKTELFPTSVLEQLANSQYWYFIQQQPLSHLLEYYWSTKDPDMVYSIAAKLLFSPVIFERKGETEMEVTLREKGANVKQTVPVDVVQDLLSRCKRFLKYLYGLDFLLD